MLAAPAVMRMVPAVLCRPQWRCLPSPVRCLPRPPPRLSVPPTPLRTVSSSYSMTSPPRAKSTCKGRATVYLGADAQQPSCPDTQSLLVVYHSRTGLAKDMAEAAAAGARDIGAQCLDDDGGPTQRFEVVLKTAAEATHADVLAAAGYVFCAPENLASVSGPMLDFFQRSYYEVFEDLLEVRAADPAPVGGREGPGASAGARAAGGRDDEDLQSRILGRPYGLAVAAGSDGAGAVRQVERICVGWRLKPVGEALVVRNGLVQTRANILRPNKVCTAEQRARCWELGGLVAARILM